MSQWVWELGSTPSWLGGLIHSKGPPLLTSKQGFQRLLVKLSERQSVYGLAQGFPLGTGLFIPMEALTSPISAFVLVTRGFGAKLMAQPEQPFIHSFIHLKD